MQEAMPAPRKRIFLKIPLPPSSAVAKYSPGSCASWGGLEVPALLCGYGTAWGAPCSWVGVTVPLGSRDDGCLRYGIAAPLGSRCSWNDGCLGAHGIRVPSGSWVPGCGITVLLVWQSPGHGITVSPAPRCPWDHGAQDMG